MNRRLIEFSVTAPGKIILFGEHSAVYEKTALAASINLRTNLSFSTDILKAQYIKLNLPDIQFYYELLVQDVCSLLAEPMPLNLNVTQGVFCLSNPELIDLDVLLEKVKSFIQLKHKGKLPLNPEQESALCSFLCIFIGMFSSVNVSIQGCVFTITSELDIGCGMGSSTAYNLCLAAAFLQFIRRKKLPHKGDPTQISKEGFRSFKYWSSNLNAFGDEDISLLSRWGFFGDRIMHGNPSGIDNAVCTYGSIIEFRKTEQTPEIKKISCRHHILNILLINTRISRNTKKLVMHVAALKDRYSNIVEPLLHSMDNIALTATEILKRLCQLYYFHDEHYSKEPEKAIAKEISKLEDLVDMNQKILESLGVSHDTIDHICRIARKDGLHAKLTGAGGGGYVFVIIPFKTKEKQVNSVKTNLERHNFPVQQIVLGGPGVTLIDDTIYEENKIQDSSTEESKVSSASPDIQSPEYVPCSYTKIPSSYEPNLANNIKNESDESDFLEMEKCTDKREIIKNMLQGNAGKEGKVPENKPPKPSNLCETEGYPGTLFSRCLPQWNDTFSHLKQQVAPMWEDVLREGEEKYSEYQGQLGPKNIRDKSLKTPNSRKQMQPFDQSDVFKNTDELEQIHADWHKPFGDFVSPFQGPADWLRGKFPPYGGRVWPHGVKLANEVKKQLKLLERKQKSVPKDAVGGCEQMRKQESQLQVIPPPQHKESPKYSSTYQESEDQQSFDSYLEDMAIASSLGDEDFEGTWEVP